MDVANKHGEGHKQKKCDASTSPPRTKHRRLQALGNGMLKEYSANSSFSCQTPITIPLAMHTFSKPLLNAHAAVTLVIKPLSTIYNLSTWVRLVIPSKIQVLSIGIYCFVIILMISCATMPPVRAAVLCSSPPFALATSCAVCTILSSISSLPTILVTSAKILSCSKTVTFSLAFRAIYIGISVGLMGNSVLSSTS